MSDASATGDAKYAIPLEVQVRRWVCVRARGARRGRQSSCNGACRAQHNGSVRVTVAGHWRDVCTLCVRERVYSAGHDCN